MIVRACRQGLPPAQGGSLAGGAPSFREQGLIRGEALLFSCSVKKENWWIAYRTRSTNFDLDVWVRSIGGRSLSQNLQRDAGVRFRIV